MIEVWKVINGYDNIYSISNIGSIKNNFSGHHLSQNRIDGAGYKTARLINKSGKYKNEKLHRLVALNFVDGYSDTLEVNHKDCNKLNNIYTNLEWITHQENIKHAVVNNLITYKNLEDHHLAVLNNSIVHEFCKLYEDNNTTVTEFAEEHSLSPSTLENILSGKTWIEISKNYNLERKGSVGELNSQAILTEDDVHEICTLIKLNTLNLTEIAELYGIGRTAISHIKNFSRWRHISVLYGLDCKTENIRKVKLNKEKVTEICSLIHNGKTNKEISVIFNVHITTIDDIRKGKSWKEVSGFSS